MEARIALTLRMVGGLTVPEIARAFLVQETTMGQRITRAKGKIKAAKIPYRVPVRRGPARPASTGVLAVLFLVFNEGYLASDPAKPSPCASDLTLEAIRLTRLLRAPAAADGEVAGLLALMLLIEARRPARVSPSGELVTLDEQDRGAWDPALIAEGHALVRERIVAVSAGRGRPGRYQILAAINAVHTSARDARDTDWSQVVALYDQLARLDPVTRRRAQPGRRARRARRARGGLAWSTGWTWTATTPTTPPAPTCSAGSAARRTPARRTSRPSSWPATPPRSRTSPVGATSSPDSPGRCDWPVTRFS